MQNSGVTLIAQEMHISNTKNKNSLYAKMSYFGVIGHIWELHYIKFQVLIFGYKWIDHKNSLKVDKLGFLIVDLNREGYKDEPFILVSQAQQVFFVPDLAKVNWSIILLSSKINEDINDSTVEDDPL